MLNNEYWKFKILAELNFWFDDFDLASLIALIVLLTWLDSDEDLNPSNGEIPKLLVFTRVREFQ